jgi:hypothetical protein
VDPPPHQALQARAASARRSRSWRESRSASRAWASTEKSLATGSLQDRGAPQEGRSADEWIPSTGRPLKIAPARVTADRSDVPAVIVVHAKGMKEAWCLATSLADRLASEIVKLYSKRFTIEETFRDQKDLHFGMGLSATHIKNADRRDRLMLLAAVAQTLLTLLGAASEASGLDRYLKVNTSKKRTHSLFRQGLYWYECIPTMREEWLRRLMDAFDRIVREQRFFREVFGVI